MADFFGNFFPKLSTSRGTRKTFILNFGGGLYDERIFTGGEPYYRFPQAGGALSTLEKVPDRGLKDFGVFTPIGKKPLFQKRGGANTQELFEDQVGGNRVNTLTTGFPQRGYTPC